MEANEKLLGDYMGNGNWRLMFSEGLRRRKIKKGGDLVTKYRLQMPHIHIVSYTLLYMIIFCFRSLRWRW